MRLWSRAVRRQADGAIEADAWADLVGFNDDNQWLCNRKGDALLDSLIFSGGGQACVRDEDIALELGCARTTVHRAMQDLSQIGLVERKRKGGTQVRTDPVTRATFDIPITRCEVEQRGSKYGCQLISRTLENSPLPVMARFGIQQPVKMLHIKALHLADTRPYIFEDRWVDTRSTPNILNFDLNLESANEWLVRNKPYSRVDVRFYAMNAEGESAEHLATNAGNALLVIERTTWIGAGSDYFRSSRHCTRISTERTELTGRQINENMHKPQAKLCRCSH